MTAKHSTAPALGIRGLVGKLALLVAALLLLPSWAPSASAASGTIKIDSDVDTSGSNNPHQGCGIAVEFYGFGPNGATINPYVVVSGQGGAGAGTIANTLPASGSANDFTFTAGTGTSTTPDFAKLYEIDTTGLTPKSGSTTTFQVDIDVYDKATGQPLSKQKVITIETCNADLAIDKQGPATYQQGGSGTYTMDVVNTGPNRAPGPIVVTDTLPAGETATSVTAGADWVCAISNAGQLVTCTRATQLLRNESASQITVEVDYSLTATTDLTDVAAIDGPRLDLVPGNDTDSVTTKPAPVMDLSLAKSAATAAGGLVPGGNVTYTLTVRNVGNVPVTSFTLADPLDAGMTHVSTSTAAGQGMTCNNADPVSCSFTGSLLFNQTRVVTVVAALPAGSTLLSVTNAAEITPPAADTNASNDTASVTTPVVHPRDLGIVKTVTSPAGGTAVTPGQGITYSLVVTNHGVAPVSSFTFSDVVPADQTLVSVSSADPRVTCTTGITCTFAAGGSPLANGQSVSATVMVTVDSTVTATSVSNTATVPADSNAANNSSTVTTAVTQPTDLMLVKTASPGTPGTGGSAAPGGTIVYTLTASNDGVLPITGFTVSDTLHGSLTLVSTTTSGAGFTCAAGNPVNCTYAGTLNAGQSVTATITATVDPAFTGTSIPNMAQSVLTSAVDSDNSNDSSSTSTPVTQPTDVALTKTTPSANAMPGDLITYTLTATNVGVLPITDFTLADPLGTGLVWQSTSTPAGTALSCTSTAPVSCTFAGGNLTTGQSVTVTVVAQVAPGFTGSSVTNAALATMAGDADTDNNDAAVSTGINHPLDLGVVKTGTPGTVSPGGTITYDLVVTNHGNGPVTSFVLTDTVPSSHTLTSVTPGAGLTCDTAVVCTYAGTLNPGGTVSVQVVMAVKPGFTGTSVTNTASVPADTNTANDSSSVTTAVTQPVDLSVLKSATPATVAPGGTITYTVTVTNQGNAGVGSFTITDPVPASQTLVSATPSDPRLTCDTAIVCTFTGAPLAPTTSVSVTVVMTVKPSVTATSVTNTATIPADSDNTDNSSTATTAVTQPMDLALAKSASPASVVAGNNVTYTLTATNVGVLPITAFTLADPLGTGLTWVSTSTASPGLTCSPSAPVSCTYAGTLTTGQSVVATVVASVSSGFTGPSVTNAASSSTPGDGNPANDRATATTSVTQPPPPPPVLVPDLAIAKSGPAGAVAGTAGSYVLTISNQGTGTATGPISVTDAVPAGTTVTSASGTGWSCTAAQTVTCSLPGGLAAGTTAAPITIGVVWGGAGTVSNTATVAAAPGETDLSDNSSNAVTVVAPAPFADLALTKTGPASVLPGDTLTWVITVTNNGTGPATGVTVTDPLATGLTLVSATGTGFSCTAGAVSCALAGALAAGSSAVLTVVATLDAAYAGATVVNTAVAGPADVTPADNSDTHVTDVAAVPPAPADLVLTKVGPAEAVQPGDLTVWVIEVTNAGGTPISGFTVTDVLSDGLTLSTASGTGFACAAGTPLVCTFAGALAPGESASVTVTALLDLTYEETTVANTATAGPADGTDDNTDTAVADVVFPITGGGGAPVVGPPAVIPPAAPGQLPVTGADALRLLALAGSIFALGLFMVALGRRHAED